MRGKKIGVIAGSPVDTGMGVDILNKRGFAAFAYPAAENAREQNTFQMLPPREREPKIKEILSRARQSGMQAILLYCNSLSSSLDVPALASELGIQIVTPLDAYRDFARKYACLGVIAGNSQGLAGIERSILEVDPDVAVIGLSLFPMVEAIEEKLPPAEISRRFSLPGVVGFFAGLGAEAVILGCTHFPYLKNDMLKFSPLPILDPAERMCELLSG